MWDYNLNVFKESRAAENNFTKKEAGKVKKIHNKIHL